MAAAPETVVTGDAVVLDVQIAQLPVRAVGALIDIVVVVLGYIVGVMLWAAAVTQFDDALSAATLIIFTVLTLVGYPIAIETATRGRSLGKMVMGLRVVSDDGGPERFRQALFRALAGFVEIWMFFGGPAVICSLLSAKGKRIGDVFAGTVVISERGPKLPPPPVMPPAPVCTVVKIARISPVAIMNPCCSVSTKLMPAYWPITSSASRARCFCRSVMTLNVG